MADETNNNGGVGLPDDLRELLARAERDDSDAPVYDPNAEDETGEEVAEEEDDDDEGEALADAGDLEGEPHQLQMIEFGQEMEQSFIEYSMSVITARALPDVRDGL